MIEQFILKNTELEVRISALGATLTHILAKNSSGKPTDVLLGFDSPETYTSKKYLANYPYLGTAIGRYGNRIGNASFSIDGKLYNLSANEAPRQLHGGFTGFDRKIWNVVDRSDKSITLQYISEDGEEGFPGRLTVDLTYTLDCKDLRIDYKAVTDKPTCVSLTHHPYFNLNPTDPDVRQHQMKLYTDKYLQTKDMVPDGVVVKASGNFKFRDFSCLGNVIDQEDGLDHCYIFDDTREIVKMAEVYHPVSGIRLTVHSNYPGLQVYTGKYLDVDNGKEGRHYGAFSGVAFEAQFWPDSPNHEQFPSTLLVPGEEYDRTTIYSFA